MTRLAILIHIRSVSFSLWQVFSGQFGLCRVRCC